MSLRKPPLNPASKALRLDEVFGQFKLKGFNASGFPVGLLAENDGTLRSQSVLYHSGTTQVRQKAETDGSVIVANYGKQTGGTLGAFNLNANNVLRVELLNGATIQVDPVLIPNAEGLLWNPGTTSASLYKLRFYIANSTASDVTGVNVGVDIGAGGSLSAGEYFVQGLIVPGNGVSGFYGPFTIDGADRIRGVAGTNNVLAIHWEITQVF